MALDPFLQQSQENVQPALSALNAGQPVFGGRFVLQRCLGQGGMGQVWLAQDTTLDEPRALKFVLPALVADATARKRLRNEARLGTHLAHPRIVRVFDFVEEAGDSPLAAVVMEYVEGRTLSELLAGQEPGFFEPEQIESWINDVVEGLRYAHEEKQRYHLDLKPGNIIVESATGRAKLLDFGISRSAKDTITRLTGHASSGTLPYMSPQQLDGEPPSANDDVYGLGATVFELLTGTPPFFRGRLEDQIRSKVPETITERRKQNAREGLIAKMGDEVAEEWSNWVSASLEKVPAGRKKAVWPSMRPNVADEAQESAAPCSEGWNPARQKTFRRAALLIIYQFVMTASLVSSESLKNEYLEDCLAGASLLIPVIGWFFVGTRSPWYGRSISMFRGPVLTVLCVAATLAGYTAFYLAVSLFIRGYV